jgi:hypothetical protein
MIILLSHTSCRNFSFGACDENKDLQRCGPKVKPNSHISCSWECRKVWGNEPTHSQVGFHVGNWGHDGLLNFLKIISRVKPNWIKNFLISLKRSWNSDVYNGLAWTIWVPKTQVMTKRKVKSQTVNLIPVH